MKRPSLLWWPRKKMTLNTRKIFSSGTKLSQTVLSRTVLMFIFLLPLLFAGCPAPERRLEKEGLTLVYRPQSEFESEIKGLRLDHPIEISKEQVTNHLLSLHYKELSLTGKRRYVFYRLRQAGGEKPALQISVFSDVVCFWCSASVNWR